MNLPTANKQIIFVDSSVQDYQNLIQGIDAAQIVILNENSSAIDQITNALADKKDIEAVHILSHGSEGRLKLGADVFNEHNLETFSTQIKQWGNALTANGDILLYGCDVAAGEVGANFVKRLSEITGADVAASTNKTGNAALGGDWALEVNIGNIETPIAFQPQEAKKYDGVLATFTVTNTNDSGAGSLREAIAQANTQTGADTIVFDPSIFTTTQTIRLNSQLIVDDSVSIQGTGLNLVKISGDANNNGINDNGDVRLFFVNQGTVSFSNLTLHGGRGNAGNGAAGGGGGLGAGGALFINGNGTSLPAQVTINNVTFTQNQAVGGNGGASNGGGGGGGFGGVGGSGGYQPGGGGGGGGLSDIGTNGTTGGGTGGGSSFFGNTGGTGGTTSNSGVASNGGFGGGGGGGLSAVSANGTNGGQGGDFGGGGAGGASQFSGVSGQGGNGGFGGGGGNAGIAANGSTQGLGGNGGFGGGGGSGNTGGGLGGSFGGNGANNGGGGGAGLGGAIFISNGSLVLTNATFNNNSATGGAGGFSAQIGQAKSGAIFVNAGATVTASGVTYSSNSATNASTTATDNSNTYGTIIVADTTPPTASTFTPADNATSVAVAADLVVTLSEAVQKGIGNVVIKKVSDNSVVETIDVASANVTVSGSTVTVNPTADLAQGTDYYVEIAAGAIKDIAGNNYAGTTGATTWNFSTVADTTPPTASTLTPADNATSVAVAADLVVTLSEAVQKGIGNVVIKKVSDNSVVETIDVASANVTVSGSTVTVNPTLDLVNGTDYYVEIASGAIKDLAGNNYAGTIGATAWNFSTVADTTPPTASTLTPADNATSVAVAADLVVTLSEAVQKGIGNVVIKKVSDNSVVETIDVASANVTVSGSTVTVNPTLDLVNGTDYYVEIASGAIKDLAGNNYAGTIGATAWNFSTVADTTPPTASTFTPADNATGVAVGADLVISLSEAVAKGTGNIVIKKVSDNSVVETIDVTSANVTVSGSTVTINPTADLAPSTEYYVEIASGAIKDSAGNDYAGITGATTWNFTTLTASTLPIPPIPQLTQNGSANTNHQGQSFTASENGTISEIAVYTGGAFTGNLLIYNSSNGSGAGGNKGTPTYQQSISLPSGMGWKTVKLDTPYSATSGQTYSVIFEGTGTFSFSNTNPYGGGNYIFNYGNANASNDLAFFINPPEIDLKGNGTSIANQDITPTTIDGTAFADTPVGSPLVRTFSIENLGSSNLTLSGTPVVTITGANASDFTVKTLPANTISASQATPFEITFQPSAIGTRTAGINISSNDLDESTYTFTIQGNGLDGTAPTASSFTPADNATSVAVGANLVVTLSESVQKGIGNIVIKKVSDNSVVETIDVTAANVTVTGSTVTVNPTADLAPGTDYYVEIAAGAIKNLAGNNYAGTTGATAWNFTTAAAVDTTAPTATFTPADNATSVAVAADLVVTLSEAVQKGTGNLVIKKVSDNSVVETVNVTAANVTVSGSTVTVNPTADLLAGTDYYVEIAAGAIKDLAGNNYAGTTGATAWNFTTAAAADTIAPTAASFTPADNATSVAVGANLVVTLSEAVQKGTGNLVIKKVSDNSVVETVNVTAANVTVSGSTVTVNPTADLLAGTDYYVEIAAGAIKDLAGNNYAGITGATAWNFTTAAVVDTTPPTASTFTPADNATSVAVAANLVVTLSEAVQKGTGNLVIKKVSDNSVVETVNVTAANVTVSGSTVTVNPTADLLANTPYYVEIAAGAIKDLAGNNYAGTTGATAWNFTTAAAADTIAPTAASFTPADNATSVAVGANLVVTLSEAVQKGTGNLVIKKVSDNSVVETVNVTAANVTVSGSTVTVNPTADLLANTPYYVEIAAGAIKDLAGNNYAGTTGATAWNFTTAAAADTIAPTAASFTPADNATSVAVGANLVVTLSEAVQKGTGNLVIKKVSDNSVVETVNVTAANVTVSGSTFTVNPTADLAPGTDYYVEIAAGAIKDLAGNNYAGTTGATAWNFNTAATPLTGTADVTPPNLSSVTSTATNGKYDVGAVIPITVKFSEAVNVTGKPELTLNSGGKAIYASGLGTDSLTFNYKVGAGEGSADLDYASISALSLAGGTIRNLANNNANLTLPTPKETNSLGKAKDIQIIPGFYSVGELDSYLTKVYKSNPLLPNIKAPLLATFLAFETNEAAPAKTLTATGIFEGDKIQLIPTTSLQMPVGSMWNALSKYYANVDNNALSRLLNSLNLSGLTTSIPIPSLTITDLKTAPIYEFAVQLPVPADSGIVFPFIKNTLGINTLTLKTGLNTAPKGGGPTVQASLDVNKDIIDIAGFKLSFVGGDLEAAINEKSESTISITPKLLLKNYDFTQDNEPDLTLSGLLTFEKDAFTGGLKLEADKWKNPFSLPDSELRSVSLELKKKLKSPSIGEILISGDLKYKNLDITLTGLAVEVEKQIPKAIVLTANKPVNLVDVWAMQYLEFSPASIVLQNVPVVRAAMNGAIDFLKKFLDLSIVSVDSDGDKKLDPLLKFVPESITIGGTAGTTIQPGFAINGQINAWGKKATLTLEANPFNINAPNFKGSLKVDNIDLEVIKIAGVDNATLDLGIAISPVEQYLKGDGKLKIFGFDVAKADFEITATKVKVKDFDLNLGVVALDINDFSVDIAKKDGQWIGFGEDFSGEKLLELRLKLIVMG